MDDKKLPNVSLDKMSVKALTNLGLDVGDRKNGSLFFEVVELRQLMHDKHKELALKKIDKIISELTYIRAELQEHGLGG